MHQTDPDEGVVRLSNMRAGVAKTVLAAQLRVDENRLRRKQLDVLPRLLADMERERARLLLEDVISPP